MYHGLIYSSYLLNCIKNLKLHTRLFNLTLIHKNQKLLTDVGPRMCTSKIHMENVQKLKLINYLLTKDM